VPVTPAEVDVAVPAAGTPLRAQTNTLLKGLITDIANVGVGIGVGTVNTFADLPAPATVTGERWWVLTSTGVWLVNRKTKGAYYSDGATWSYLGDFPVTAVEIGNTPAGGIAAVNVQAAIDELDTEKAPKGLLTASGLTQATARFLGRLTAGTGAVEELTATQLTAQLDVFTSGLKGLAPASGGGTTNFLRADGTWAAAGGAGADPLPLANVPTTPGAGIISVGRSEIAEFGFLSFAGSSGLTRLIQPFIGTIPMTGITGFSGATFVNLGGPATIVGTPGAVAVTNTDAGTRTPRINLPTSATAGNVAGSRAPSVSWFVGNPTSGGGVFFITTFTQGTDVAGKRVFFGVRAGVGAPGNANPAALTDSFGIGCIDGSNNWHIVFGGSAAQTPVDLGANFPCRTPLDDKIQFAMYWPPGDNSGFYYEVIRNDGAFTASGFVTNTTPGTTLPATSTALGAHNCYWTNNATASVMSMRVSSILTLVL
jgi:hypothetical protein